MTTTAPPPSPCDAFENRLATYIDSVRPDMPSWAVQYLADEIRTVHAELPDYRFADAVALAKAALNLR